MLTVLVVAVVFLLGSIGGATAAAKINGKDIKKKSIPLTALSKDAVKSLQGKAGPAGPRAQQVPRRRSTGPSSMTPDHSSAPRAG